MSLFFLVASYRKIRCGKKGNTRDSPKKRFAAKLVKRVKKQQGLKKAESHRWRGRFGRTSVLVGSEDTVGNPQWSR